MSEIDAGPSLGLAPTEPSVGAPANPPHVTLDYSTSPSVFPYLPAPTSRGVLQYAYQVIVRPQAGIEAASAMISRFTWNTDPTTKQVYLAKGLPLEIAGAAGQPVPVDPPAGMDSSRPQLWVIESTTASDLLVGTAPRRADLPLLQVIAGKIPPSDLGDHVMALPPRIDLPEMRHILPCKIQIFPLTPTCGIAVRFRMSENGVATGVTPYIFKATLSGPRSWNLLSGRKILEEDPVTGETESLVEAMPQAGQLAPLVTVFKGQCLVAFSWRATPSAPCFNVAAFAAEERPPEVAEASTGHFTQ